MVVTKPMAMLDPGDLKPADEAVIDLLKDGRVTVAYAAENLDYNKAYIREVLQRLVEHGVVDKISRGLYELQSDPRELAKVKNER